MTRALQIPQRFQAREDLNLATRIPKSELPAKRCGQPRTGTRPPQAELALHRCELLRLGEGFLDAGTSPAHAAGLAGWEENVQTYLWGTGRASPSSLSKNPLVAFVSFGSNSHRNPVLEQEVTKVTKGTLLQFSQSTESGGSWTGSWYRQPNLRERMHSCGRE